MRLNDLVASTMVRPFRNGASFPSKASKFRWIFRFQFFGVGVNSPAPAVPKLEVLTSLARLPRLPVKH